MGQYLDDNDYKQQGSASPAVTNRNGDNYITIQTTGDAILSSEIVILLLKALLPHTITLLTWKLVVPLHGL
ncbi:hypothetical protein J6590_080640 [Homalodisca vitripennis]|nr:hypothetical protein J6590_080640 [Homalodisca vitripennis]